MTEEELLELFREQQREIDSEPFAHEQKWSGDQPKEGPR